MAKRVVVIGGVACGPKAACRFKRLEPSAEVIVVEKGGEISYGACGLPYFLEGEIGDTRDLTTTPVGVPRDVQFFKAVKGVDVRIRTEALEIDRARKVVRLRNLETRGEEDLAYDQLVLATGSFPVRPPIPGIALEGIHALKSLGDGRAIKAAMAASQSRKAVIVGAGLIGLECAEALVTAGFEVHVVEKLASPLPALLDPEMAAHLAKHLAAKGVRLHLETEVTSFEDDGQGRLKTVRTSGGAIEADLVVLAIGFRPEVDLARKAGLEIGRFGIRVDAHLRTSDPDIYAGGDCVESRHVVTGRPIYAPMGSTANKQGRVIGNNLAGWNSTFRGVAGTAVCRILGFHVARTGLSEREAKAEGLEVLTALTPGPDKPHYMKDSRPIHLKLVTEAYSGRILGAQILGPGEVLAKVDTVAALLAKNATVDDLADLDMAYAPPFSHAMDNLIVAANVVQNKKDGVGHAYSPDTVKAKIDAGEDFVLLDVRTPKEVEAMRLTYPNVTYIPLGKLRERCRELPEDKEIVTLCKISLRGYEAEKILAGVGEKMAGRVKFLDGGIVAWPYEKEVKG